MSVIAHALLVALPEEQKVDQVLGGVVNQPLQVRTKRPRADHLIGHAKALAIDVPKRVGCLVDGDPKLFHTGQPFSI